MVQIARCITYAGHTVYEDGRVYRHHELLKTCKTFAAAKAWATRAMWKERAASAAEHHQRVNKILGRTP